MPRAPAPGATFVYVSNADDGDIGTYRLLDSGELQVGPRAPAAPVVMPMAVSPDRRFLYAASRSKPCRVHAFTIDRGTGALRQFSSAPLAESFPYIALDRTGRFLFGASYAGNLVSVNAIDDDGRVAVEPLQVIPVGRNAHSIRVDASNRFVYVPTLGSGAVFMFTFDAATGKLTANTPEACPVKAGAGPRHFVISGDNRFLFLLGEMAGTVTTLAIDAKSGVLTEVGTVFGLPPDTKLLPGFARGSIAGRNMDNDIWAADLHLTPDGRFLYASERTSSTISAFAVDPASGKLTYLSNAPTERQPRGFCIDPKGRFLVAAGEKSDTLGVHAIDPSSGALERLGRYPAGKGANWVEIVAFD